MGEYAYETDENEFIFFKSQFNYFVITEIVKSDLRHTPWAKILILDSGIPCIERQGWTSSVYLTPISAGILHRYYTPKYEVYGGYIGFTLSVYLSVDIFCKDYFSETICQNFMKLHSNDRYQA